MRFRDSNNRKDAAAQSGRDGLAGISGAATRSGTQPVRVRVLLLASVLLLAAVGLLFGCTRAGEPEDNNVKYAAGIVIYYSGLELPADSVPGAFDPCEVSLKYVTEAEAAYFSHAGLGQPELADFKNRLAAALLAGAGMTKEELDGWAETAREELLYTYRTDNALRAEYDSRYDTFAPDAFALLTYGVDADGFALVRLEQYLIGSYLASVTADIAAGLTTAEVEQYYAAHRTDFDYADLWLLRLPDSDGTLAASVADGINAAPAEARETVLKEYETLYPGAGAEDEESQSVLLRTGENYTGVYAAALERVEGNAGQALVLEYEGSYCVAYLRGIVGPAAPAGDTDGTDGTDATDNGSGEGSTWETVRTALAETRVPERIPALVKAVELVRVVWSPDAGYTFAD